MLTVAKCVHCGVNLSTTQKARQNHCGQISCQLASVRLFHNHKKERDKELKQLVKAICEQQLLTDNLTPLFSISEVTNQQISVILLPANTNDISALSETRKTNFLTHLSTLYDAIENNTPMDNHPYSLEVESEYEQQPEYDSQLAQACGTCKGYCCLLGNDHAFQDIASLQAYLKTQPNDLSKNQILQQYQYFLPKESCTSGCVFQQKNGCALPRKMRSFTCNRYSCNELKDYNQQLKNADESVTFAGAVADNEIVRAHIIIKNNTA